MPPAKKVKKGSAIKKANATFDVLADQLLENETEFVHLLTQTAQGKTYPINHRNPHSLLEIACAQNKTVALQAILARNDVDVNLKSKSAKLRRSACTALHVAIDNGHIECVKLLYQAPGIDLNVRGADGSSPFTFAVASGDIAIVKFFLEEIPDGIIDYNTGPHPLTPFMLGICMGHKRITKLLIASNRVNHHYHPGVMNAMDCACASGSESMIRLIEAETFEESHEPEVASNVARSFQDNGVLTERRAFSEDYALRNHVKSCDGCKKEYKRSDLQRCSVCMEVWYCSKECQKADWKSHKTQCAKRT